jgi:hypothetical protein
MPLYPFFSRENQMPLFPWLHWLCLLPNYPNPLLSKAEWHRYCVHLRILNVCDFRMVETTGLKNIYGIEVTFNCVNLPTIFREDLPVDQKVNGGHGQTDAQTG